MPHRRRYPRALWLSMGEDEVTVHPDGDLSLEVEATERKSKAKIEIAIAWRHRSPDKGEN